MGGGEGGTLAALVTTMRRALILCLLATTASAEPRVTLGGMFYGRTKLYSDTAGLDPVGGPRLLVSVDPPLVAPPAHDGWDVGGAIIPDVGAGLVYDGTNTAVLASVGIRAELRLAQRQGEATGRGAVYAVARGISLGDHFQPGGELGFGAYLATDAGTRFGGEFGVAVRRQYDQAQPFVGGMLFVGF